MGIDEKLDYFAQVMQSEAAAINQRARRRHAAQTEADLQAAVAEARHRADEYFTTRAHEAKIARYKAIAAATAHERTRLWERKQMLVKDLFAEVAAQIHTFAASGAYRGYLEEAIRKATQLGGYTIVQLMQRDADTALPDHVTAEITQRDFLGGFILFNTQRTMQVDFTLQTRLNEGVALALGNGNT